MEMDSEFKQYTFCSSQAIAFYKRKNSIFYIGDFKFIALKGYDI